MREWTRPRWALVLAVLAVLGGGDGTLAGWADARTVPGTSLHTGTLDLQVDGHDDVTGYDALDVAALVPGGGRAAVLTLHNAGDVPLDYQVSVTGTDPDGRGLAGALATTVTPASATDGSTCGGTPLATGTLAPGADGAACVELGLPADAPAALAGAATDLTVAVQASVRGAWTDEADVSGVHVSTVALTPPSIRCGALGLGSVDIAWDPVPGATGYRVESTALPGGATELDPGTTDFTLTGLAGTVAVRAEFGSATWLSAPSNQLGFDALSLVTVAVCS